MTIPHGRLFYHSCAIQTKEHGGLLKGTDAYDQAIARAHARLRGETGISHGLRGKERPDVQYDRDPERTTKVLATIRTMYAETDLPLTVRDIQRACALSSTSVADFHVRKLEGEGKIRREPGKARSIRPVIEEAAA